MALSSFVRTCVENPSVYTAPQDLGGLHEHALRALYGSVAHDQGPLHSAIARRCPVPTLEVVGFDHEQIWEQIQLLNEAALGVACKNVASLELHADTAVVIGGRGPRSAEPGGRGAQESGHSHADTLSARGTTITPLGGHSTSSRKRKRATHMAAHQDDDNDDDDDDDDDDDNDNNDDDDDNDDNSKDDNDDDRSDAGANDLNGSDDDTFESGALKKKAKTTASGDEFFSIEAMNEFLDAQDRLDGASPHLDVDLFADPGTADKDAAFGGFFDENGATRKVSSSRGNGLAEDDSEADDGDEENAGSAEGSDDDSAASESDIDSGAVDEDDDAGDSADSGDSASEKEDGEPGGKSALFEGGESDDGSDAVPTERLSRFEREQRRLQRQIEQLEDANVAPKPWQLSGETHGQARPVDSLLQEDLEFEVTTRPAPEITAATTTSLESMICKRIKDNDFDDVERKAALEGPVFRPTVHLDHEKSKESLGEVYEKDYLQTINKTPSEVEAKLGVEHEEIKALLVDLDTQLNALSNFHYVPPRASEAVEIVANVPALRMEDVTPATVSTAARLAPHELHMQGQALLGQSEREDTDRRRERRSKKKTQRLEKKRKEQLDKAKEKLIPGFKLSKKRAAEKLNSSIADGSAKNIKFAKKSGKSVGTSSQKFFQQLQEQESMPVSSQKSQAQSESREKRAVSASAFKL